jgi:hypothetical protein
LVIVVVKINDMIFDFKRPGLVFPVRDLGCSFKIAIASRWGPVSVPNAYRGLHLVICHRDLMLRKVLKGNKVIICPGVKQRLHRIFNPIYKQIDSSQNWKGARIL